MRVIFTGQTGINCDSEVLKNLGLFCKKMNDPIEGLKLYSLNEELESLDIDMISFLDSQNPKTQADIWKKAFNQILSKLKDEDPKHAFLSIHHIFYRYSSFFSPVEWDLIKEFQPDIFITLIDDLYSIWKRIKSRNEESPSESHFCLRELSSWRSAEILMTDLLAKSLSSSKKIIRNYVVAVKHPAQMLHGLIFKPEKLIVYTAFPITSTRKVPEKVDEINSFRMKLHEKFIVFDPITIDEDILRILLEKQPPKRKETLLVGEKDRWPIPHGWSLCKDVDYPIELEANDALEVVQDLKDHIMLRDYRLIEQADCLAGYRPYYERQRSLGVFAEMTYARDVAYKRRFFVHFPDKDGEPKDSPFASSGVPFATVENLIKALRNIEKNKKNTKGNNNI